MKQPQNKPEEIRDRVRSDYAKVADSAADGACCSPGCCSPQPRDSRGISSGLGYSDQELDAVPDASNLGLGCGNPQAIASLKPGETVLDLGSGAGFDAFLAARQVGAEGRVIGVDMTPEMIAKANANRDSVGLDQVEFRHGQIEKLPIGDAEIDVVISNCVINLSPEKHRVLAEAFRVLRPDGRVAISDVVLTAELPEEILADLGHLSACVSGAVSAQRYETLLAEAGFIDISVVPVDESREFIRDWVPGEDVSKFILSASITGRKPDADSCCPPSCCEG